MIPQIHLPPKAVEPTRVPEPFAAAVSALQGELVPAQRTGLSLHEIPGPRRLA